MTKPEPLTTHDAEDPVPAFALNPERERKAFEATRAQMLALAPHAVRHRSVSLESLRRACLELGRALSQPLVAERLARLVPYFIPADALERVVELGHAAGHIDRRLRDTTALLGHAQLAPAELEEAEALRAVMSAIVGHNCKSRPAALDRLALVGTSRSYLSLAEDLDRLADLYAENHDLVSQDGVNFSPAQAVRAQELYASIKSTLETGQAGLVEWQGLAHRCFTLVQPRYELLYEGARFALIGHPERAALRPLGRYRKAPTRGAGPADEAAAPDPAPPPAVGGEA